MSDKLVLIHLSDIHFSHANAYGSYDLDREIRNELTRDAKVFFDESEAKPQGILVSGDVAYAGKQQDYRVASEWLSELCAVTGCPVESVWTAPGNHDVDRDEVKGSELLKLIHEQIRAQGAPGIDDKLKTLLADKQARHMLFAPLRNYNAFAARYDCEVGPDRLVWEHDLALNDGSTLRIRGLNSVLVSDEKDNDREGKLALGAAQTLLLRQEGVEYLTVCHHPPDWLLDQDEVHEALTARARIQLFGHKHSQRIDKINETLRLCSGAMHPERAERKWQPRFNFLLLSVQTTGEQRTLCIDVAARVWDEVRREFVPDRDPKSGSEARHFELKLDAWTPPRTISTVAAKVTETQTGSATATQGYAMNPVRTLTYRFLSLPFHVRLEVAGTLGLIADEDKDVSDAELFRRVFRRASERGQLAALWEATAKRQQVEPSPNPFTNA